MTYFSVDIETLDTANTAVIASIGAVSFSHSERFGQYSDQVDWKDQLKRPGFTISKDTLIWWLGQPSAAQELTLRGVKNIKQVLQDYSNFVCTEEINPKRRIFISRDPDFDGAILANAFKMCGLEDPFPYYNRRSHRTISALFKSKLEYKMDPTLPHVAINDAIQQADYVQAVLKDVNYTLY